MRRPLALLAVLATCIWPAMADETVAVSNAIPASDTVALTTEAGPGDDAVIREIPRPASAPLPTAPPTPRPAPSPYGPGLRNQAGSVSFSVEFEGAMRTYHTSASANGERVRGTLSSNGIDTLGAPLGVITLGDAAHRTSIGELNDPLSGLILRSGAFSGIDVHRGIGGGDGFDAYSGRRLDGHSLYALEHVHGNTTDTFGILSEGGNRFGSALLRHEVITSTRWGSVDQEILAGTHGLAVGIQARTRGRTFVDATLTRAIGTLPLADGDLPSTLSVGRLIGTATTVTAGFAETQGAPARTFVAGSTRLRNVTFAANASKGSQNMFVSASGNGGFAQFFASTGSQTILGMRGSFAVRGAQFEFDGTRSGGATNGSAQFRTGHAGLNYAAGMDFSNGKARPLLGVISALTPALALEAALIPGNSGRPAVRFSIVAGFSNRAPHSVTFPLAIAVNGPTDAAPLRLFIDGRLTNALRGGRGSIALPAGTHDVYVATTDGAYGSTQRQILAGVDRTISIDLIPQRTIHGRVRFAVAAGQVPVTGTLDGVRIVLAPSGLSVVCDADGVFVFPRAPYDPQTTLLLDPDTLPRGFLQPDPIAIDAADDLDVALASARRTERQIFR